MTNNTFKVISTEARSYQGFPYANPPVHDAPSIPAESRPTDQPAPPRPTTLDLRPEETNSRKETAGSEPRETVSLAERELRQNYGRERIERQHQRYIDTTSPCVDETIFYDPFENRRIIQPKESPEVESTPNIDPSSDEDETPQPIRRYDQSRPFGSSATGTSLSAIRDPMSPGPSYGLGSSSGSVYYTKESGLYGRTADSLPEVIPVENFPEPPPAYSEIDIAPQQAAHTPRVVAPSTPSPVTAQPMPQVITTPTPTVGHDPTSLYNPSRKYITCQYCGQRVLTVIKKEPSCLTHSVAVFNVCCGLMPCALCVYCTDYFKQSRHYCPNCDLLVGKEAVTCNGIVYVQT